MMCYLTQIMPKDIVRLLRPQQWLKNLFVFLPLFFSGQIINLSEWGACLIAFAAFSFTASAVYCFNDIIDAAIDKMHPEKRCRPIASGRVGKMTAYITIFVLLLLAVSVVFFWSGEKGGSILLALFAYVFINVAYSLKLKQIAIIDVFIVAIGFVIRVVVGGIVTGVVLSQWIILMTFLLALFLAFAKRRDDVVLFQSSGVSMRKNIGQYNLDFINQVITIIGTITIVCYIMYSVSDEVTKRFENQYVYITSVFVLAGIIRYMQLTLVNVKSGNPTHILMHDRFIQLCIAAWVATFCIIIYL